MNPVEEPLADIVRRARCLLFDFDGPVCAIFAGYPAPVVAEGLRALLERRGMAVPRAIRETTDPLHVLRLTADYADELTTQTVAEALRDAEIRAVATAEPTPYAAEVIRAARETGRKLAIVSNNSAEAVTAYLRQHRLDTSFACIAGRYPGMDVRELKPSGHLVTLALHRLNATSATAALIGDSPRDITAAQAVSVATIGYANRPSKAARLAHAGADAVMGSMADLAAAIQRTPVAS